MTTVPHFGFSFVIKTTEESGRKAFINMCSSPAVPAPGNWPSAAAVPQEVTDALARLNQGAGPAGVACAA
jgi:PIH1 N-terminal domain